jgi:hypothetical protein
MAAKEVLDFSQVKDGGAFSPKHKPEGEYLGKVISFQDTKSKAGSKMWVYGVALKNDRRAVYPVYCLLGPEQVWKLRNMMEATGLKVPKKKMSVDGSRLIGKELGLCLEDDEYEGKKKSVISSFFPASEYEGDDSDDDDDDEEPEEEYEDEPADDEDEDTEESEDDAEDEDEDEEDDEDEPEDTPPPAKKAAVAKKAPARAAPKKKPAPVEDDEDEDEMDVEDL